MVGLLAVRRLAVQGLGGVLYGTSILAGLLVMAYIYRKDPVEYMNAAAKRVSQLDNKSISRGRIIHLVVGLNAASSFFATQLGLFGPWSSSCRRP